MKRFAFSIGVTLVVLLFSCKKTSLITSPDASVYFSSDTLHFDTVFTTTGSVTQLVKIFNQNDQKLRLSSVQLMGGAGSAFRMNVDGSAGVSFANIELEPNDSVYVFVSVSVNPNAANLPFIVQDSILISYNGNNRFIQLDAFGQNANFYRNRHVTTDSTWHNDLPYVILEGLTVDSNITLTIEKGCKIFSHGDAPFIVNGTLKITGEAFDSTRVVFKGDRTDPVYKDLPGSWPGIFFTSSSHSNQLDYAVIKNAYQGIITEGTIGTSPKIILNQCIIDNVSDAGIVSYGSSIRAINCLISNCGINVYLQGGNDTFFHCTLASYGTFFLSHKNPVLYLTDDVLGNLSALNALFVNCIFYGDDGSVDDEVVFAQKHQGSNAVLFQNVLYKNSSSSFIGQVFSSINNANPEFANIDAARQEFDFHLKATSPALDTGSNLSIIIDLDGKLRPDTTFRKPDLGCYELQ